MRKSFLTLSKVKQLCSLPRNAIEASSPERVLYTQVNQTTHKNDSGMFNSITGEWMDDMTF